MPRYRIVKTLPDVLVYRDGSRILLERFVSVYSVDILHAKKDLPGQFSAVVLLRGNTPSIDEQLEKGFDIDVSNRAGAAADRIMQSLVAKGYAKLVVD